MFRYRRHFMIILIIMVTSVFLSSCGLGLPFELSVRITASDSKINVTSEPVDFAFEAGPSLFLVYAYSHENRLNTDSTSRDLNSAFLKITDKKPAVPLDTRNKYFEYTSKLEDQVVEVYLYSPLTSSYLPNDFSYHAALTVNSGRIDETVTYELDSETGTIRVGENTYKINESLGNGYYYIFAGVTASNSSYLDVSSLYYIDEFELNN